MTLSYETVKTVEDPLIPTREIYPRLLEHQESHRRAELEAAAVGKQEGGTA